MFGNASEHTKPEEALMLNNFRKDDHYLQYEAEYILAGNRTEIINAVIVIGLIYTLRVALNTIYLLTDAEKLKNITDTANAIAGWWSMGVGSAVMAVIFTLVWAMTESVSDVKQLLAGEAVVLFKTKETWKTDIFSGILNAAIKETTGVKSEEVSIIPKLSYQDYLRLFLLAGLVDEKTKLLRVMDLIQLNISKDRGEDVSLAQYLTGLESSAEMGVQYIFFQLPFMPEDIKAFGSRYYYKKEFMISY